MNKRLSIADVARIADLTPSTVEDWRQRGTVAVQEGYTIYDALRFTVVRSLVGHGVLLHRASAILTGMETSGIWPVASSSLDHLYVFAITFGSQTFRVDFYAGDSVAADRYIEEKYSVEPACPTGDKEYAPERPQPADEPRFRIVRYDIGPDLRRAFREIEK